MHCASNNAKYLIILACPILSLYEKYLITVLGSINTGNCYLIVYLLLHTEYTVLGTTAN